MNEKIKKQIIIEMKEHLEHILLDITEILYNHNKYIIDNVDKIMLIIVDLKERITTREDLFKLDLKQIKELSNMVYDLNYNNKFSPLTDHLCNELFAFNFILEEELKIGKERNVEKGEK